MTEGVFLFSGSMKKITMMVLLVGIGIITAISFSSCKKKQGCTNKDALNFDSEAKKDDGTCIAVEEVQKSLLLKYSSLS